MFFVGEGSFDIQQILINDNQRTNSPVNAYLISGPSISKKTHNLVTNGRVILSTTSFYFDI